MTPDGIFLVTEALRERLTMALTASQVPGTVFVGPLDDANARGSALILFLYRIVPNVSLRNHERRVPKGQVVGVLQNALPLDLYYLVTVGTNLDSGEETMLKALGYVIQAFQADPALTGPAVNQETVRVTLEPLTTEEASRIWTLFPAANYRTSIAYLATPVWIDPPQVTPPASPVIADQLTAGYRAAEAMI